MNDDEIKDLVIKRKDKIKSLVGTLLIDAIIVAIIFTVNNEFFSSLSMCILFFCALIFVDIICVALFIAFFATANYNKEEKELYDKLKVQFENGSRILEYKGKNKGGKYSTNNDIVKTVAGIIGKQDCHFEASLSEESSECTFCILIVIYNKNLDFIKKITVDQCTAKELARNFYIVNDSDDV